jgi:hypothetical protein
LWTWLEQGDLQNKYGFRLVDCNQKAVTFILVDCNQKTNLHVPASCTNYTSVLSGYGVTGVVRRRRRQLLLHARTTGRYTFCITSLNLPTPLT